MRLYFSVKLANYHIIMKSDFKINNLTYTHFFCRWGWITNDSREQTFRQIGIHSLQILIHCVFSSSDVGSKWKLLCSLLHPTKHINRLIGDILVYICSGVETMADWWQLTQGGSKVRRPCRSTIVGGAWLDFYNYRVVVHTLPTHIYVLTTCKSEFCIRWPL